MNYTYEEYLEEWNRSYDEYANETTIYYWKQGKKVETTIQKLTQEEFNQHIAALSLLSTEATAAKGNAAIITEVLRQRLPHELVLLI